MTVLYFGSEMDAGIGSDNTVVETTSQSAYDATYSRCAVYVANTQTLSPVSFASVNAGYFHGCHQYRPFNNGEKVVFRLRTAGGTTVFYLSADGFSPNLSSVTYRMYYYNGSGYTQIGSSVVAQYSANQNIDLHVIGGSSGSAELFIADSSVTSGSASMGNVGSITNVQYCGADAGGGSYWSQWIGATTSTVGFRLKTIVEDTNGAVQNWTGLVTNINEFPYDDATGITSSSANDISTYYLNGLSLTGLNIFGMGTSARFNTTSGPTGIQNILRVNSQNYNGSTVTGSASFAINQNMWLTNPNSGQVWTPSTAAAIEWGVKSIA